MPVHALNNSRAEKPVSKPAVQGKAVKSTNGPPDMDKAQTEEERIAAMFKAGAEQWDKQQQEMAKYVYYRYFILKPIVPSQLRYV